MILKLKEINARKSSKSSYELSELICFDECKFMRWYEDEGYYYCGLEDRPNRNWSVDEADFCSWGEAEQAIEVVAEALERSCDNDCEHCEWATCPKMEQEPKLGKWIDVSERGSWATKNACDQCSEIVFQPNYNYCPNCGARMGSDTQ